MRNMLLLISTLLLAATPVHSARVTPEEELARTLKGRVAGEPVDCIYLPLVRSSRIIRDTAIVYDAGRTIYVNRPEGGAQALDQSDILVTRPFGSQLCSIDVVQLIDSSSRFYSGTVFLGKFVPYRKDGDRRD